MLKLSHLQNTSRGSSTRGVAFFLAILTLASLVGAGFSYRSARRFADSSVTTNGVVIRIDEEERIEKTDGKTVVKRQYYPIIAFTPDASAEPVQFRAEGSSNSARYQVQETVAIRYLPDNPKKAKIDSFSSLWGLSMSLGVFGAILGIGLGIMLLTLRGKKSFVDTLLGRSNESLIKVQGALIKVRAMGDKTSGNQRYILVAEYQDPKTQAYYTYESELLHADPTPYIKNKPITIEVDPANLEYGIIDLSFIPQAPKNRK